MKRIFNIAMFIAVIFTVLAVATSCQPSTDEQPCSHLNVSSEVADPTCVSEGYTEHVCLDCGYVYYDTFVEISDDLHEFVAIMYIDSTCTQEGRCDVMCVYCGKIETETIKVKDHEYGEWTTVKETTCTELGYDERVCKGCGLVNTRQATKTLDHNYGEGIITLPTCTQEGYTAYVCADCGYVDYTDKTSVAGHTYGEGEVIEATCSEEGYTLFKCVDCDYEHKDNYTPTIEHTFGEWQVSIEATCEANGEEKRACLECGYTESRTVIAHDYCHTYHAPNCDTPGYDHYECTKCGHSYIDNYTDALGHTFGEWYSVEGYDNAERRDCECGYFEVRSKSTEE